jgi:hypothetical protein
MPMLLKQTRRKSPKYPIIIITIKLTTKSTNHRENESDMYLRSQLRNASHIPILLHFPPACTRRVPNPLVQDSLNSQTLLHSTSIQRHFTPLPPQKKN